MAKKRTFSNRSGSDVFWGGRRPEYSFPEMDQPRKAKRERSATGRERPPSQPERQADERPKQRERVRTTSRPRARVPIPKAARKPRSPRTDRSREARAARRGPSLKAALILGAVVAVIVLGAFFIFLYPSPIKGLTPKPGGKASAAGSVIKVEVKSPIKKGQYTLVVDGRDVTDISTTNGKIVTCNASLADGAHKAKFVLKGAGVMGTRSKEWAFTVDANAPKLVLTKKTVTPVKGSTNKVTVNVTGETEKGATVQLASQALKVDGKGFFTGTADTERSKSVELVATDPAGNASKTYVVTQNKPDAKGIHVSIYMAASDSDLGKLLGLVQRTELNAMEVDLKDEAGMIGFAYDNALAKQAKAPQDLIKLDAVVDRLRYNDVYTICRIVTFKDPKLAKARPDLAVHNKSGAPWGPGFWLDPYSKEVWDYDIGVAIAAAKAGFNEVQFDYMRFPSDGDTTTCVYPHQDGRTPKDVISGYLQYAREQLAPYNVFVSADLFGLTASNQGEMGIGQNVPAIAKQADYISPMVYPSHYHLGEYNIKVPENNPGDTVYRSLEDFLKETKGTSAKLRPWLQDFSLKVHYTPEMVRAQIDATEKAGVDEWLLWDPNCTYSESALKTAAQTKNKSSAPTK
jgi:hypothetical protein